MLISSLLAFLVPTLALNLTPGPDMFFVIGRATKAGPRGALHAAAGLWVGYLFHIALVCLGLAAVLQKFPTAFMALKYAGAAYLLYLGGKLLLSRGVASESGTDSQGGFLQGILVSALNPKVAIFFLAFLPQFVSAEETHVTLHLFGLGLLFSFTSTLVNLGAGMLAYLAKKRGAGAGRGPISMERACGLALLGMAMRLTLAR